MLSLLALPFIAACVAAKNMPEERARPTVEFLLNPSGKYYYYVDDDSVKSKVNALIRIWKAKTCLTFEYYEYSVWNFAPGNFLYFSYDGSSNGPCTNERTNAVTKVTKSSITIKMTKRCKEGRPLMTAFSEALGLLPGGNDEYSIMGGNKGTNENPSFNDLNIINNILYRCPAKCSTKANCNNGGYVIPKNCNRCICPKGTYGNNCQHKASQDAPSGDWKRQIANKATAGSNGAMFEEIISNKLKKRVGERFSGAAGAAAGNTIKSILKGEHENVPYSAAGGAAGAIFTHHFSKKLTSKVENKVLSKAMESAMSGGVGSSVEEVLKGDPVGAIKSGVSGGIGDAVGAAVGEAIGEAIGMEFGGPLGSAVVGAASELAGELVGDVVDRVFDWFES